MTSPRRPSRRHRRLRGRRPAATAAEAARAPPHDSADGGGARRARPARRPAAAAGAAPTTLLAAASAPRGSYAAFDTSWQKAGMLLLIGDGGASGEGLLERLQSSLHFLSSPSLPAVVRDASAPRRVGLPRLRAPDLIAEVLEDVRQQSGGLHLLAIVGCGGGADACLALVASSLCPPRPRARAGGRRAYSTEATSALGASAPSVEVLSIHGAADEAGAILRAQLCRARPLAVGCGRLEGGHHFA